MDSCGLDVLVWYNPFTSQLFVNNGTSCTHNKVICYSASVAACLTYLPPTDILSSERPKFIANSSHSLQDRFLQIPWFSDGVVQMKSLRKVFECQISDSRSTVIIIPWARALLTNALEVPDGASGDRIVRESTGLPTLELARVRRLFA